MNAIIPARSGERWECYDLGLRLNKTEGHTFWNKGEIVQAQANINGHEVIVVRHSGRVVVAMDMYGVKVNGVVIVDRNGSPYLKREEAIDVVDSTRVPTGDYVDAECSD